MAGHSKWANIRHKKGRQDQVRGKKFTQLIREITVATQESGPDPAVNPRLRLAMDKAQQANMPKDTIMRAVQRGNGPQDTAAFEAIRYEGYGPGGVAIMITCLTDNRNRTVGEVRHALSQSGGNLGTEGSVAYLFNYEGLVLIKTALDEDTIMERAIEAGAQDVIYEESIVAITTDTESFNQLRQLFVDDASCEVEEATLRWVPTTECPVDEDTAEKIERLIEKLEDLDDVQAVFSNVAWPDSVGSQ
ncbi:MAG: YebC/PmpR family DNA-binding transcriptional regulator [Legionellales bacterium]|nr:YebC/PmpR family DNA-binding transcriptional regulator [Legionellales bacterium]